MKDLTTREKTIVIDCQTVLSTMPFMQKSFLVVQNFKIAFNNEELSYHPRSIYQFWKKSTSLPNNLFF